MHGRKNLRLSSETAVKTAAVLAAFLFTAFNFGGMMKELRAFPASFYAENDQELEAELSDAFSYGGVSVAAESTADDTLGRKNVSCRLFGLITLKTSSAYVSKRAKLVPGGCAVGISIYTDGVLVVGTGSFRDKDGVIRFPAQEAGIIAGDIILSVNGRPISSSEELCRELDASRDEAMLLVERDGIKSEISVAPAVSENGEKRIGAWVRDSTVGIGTLSFYDPVNGVSAALGHAVIDADTGSLLKVKDGTLVLADVIGVTRGRQGAPGELHGTFDSFSFVLGRIELNTELGIFGTLTDSALSFLGGETLETAFPDEVRVGDAELISNVDGRARAFSCRIVRADKQDSAAPKGLVVEITDEELIGITGGIVQGMSGSPVIQDGRLVGVITHVLVNDPRKGYGAYAYWMYNRTGG